jgi:dTDP-4-dehydrorhamnose reductase
VIGSAGQVGSDLCRALALDPRLPAVAGLTRAQCDITDPGKVRAVLRDQARPAKIQGGLTVINTAAWTDVDGAECDEDGAYAVNAAGPAHLAAACAEVGATLIHLSTDYVFDGAADKPYEVDDHTAPVSAYGRTKLAGDQAVLALSPAAYVVRTAWVYGAVGRNFVKTMARFARERDALTVVDDQRGSPTWSADLAAGLVELAFSGAPRGLYHYTNAGDTTWFGFAQAIMEEIGVDPAKARPTTTAAFPRPAPRPAYSVLSMRCWLDAGLPAPRHWRDALSAAFAAHPTELRG